MKHNEGLLPETGVVSALAACLRPKSLVAAPLGIFKQALKGALRPLYFADDFILEFSRGRITMNRH